MKETDVDKACDQLQAIVGDVVSGKLTEEQAQPKVAEVCTAYGPQRVKPLNSFYNAALREARS
jgi:hypothetical protein